MAVSNINTFLPTSEPLLSGGGVPSIAYPRINGIRPDFACTRLSLVSSGTSGVRIPGPLIAFVAIDYDETLNPTSTFLSSPRMVARSRGAAHATGSVEWHMEEARALMAWLVKTGAGGFGDAIFDLVVSYSLKPGQPLITDVLKSVRFLGGGQRNHIGGGALTTTTPLAVSGVKWGKIGGGSSLVVDVLADQGLNIGSG